MYYFWLSNKIMEEKKAPNHEEWGSIKKRHRYISFKYSYTFSRETCSSSQSCSHIDVFMYHCICLWDGISAVYWSGLGVHLTIYTYMCSHRVIYISIGALVHAIYWFTIKCPQNICRLSTYKGMCLRGSRKLKPTCNPKYLLGSFIKSRSYSF